MASEIRLVASTAYDALKAQILNEAGLMWNGSALVAESSLSDAEWTASLVAVSSGATGDSTATVLHKANWPGGLTQSALYSVVFFNGASPVPGSEVIGVQEDPTEHVVGSASGSGALSTTIYCQTDGGVPIDGVEVWITNDLAGANVVAGTISSDATGLVTFMLDAGTYYVWKQLSGYDFTNPIEIVVAE